MIKNNRNKIYEQYKNLPEIISKRTYNQKVYDNSSKGRKGSQRYRIHACHIHYKNELDKFEDIDTTLHFDPIKKAWKHNKASYHPTIPEYADGWFEFYNAYKGINHTIKAKPICNHIKGIVHNGQDKHYVLYKNAFGKNIDLKVSAYWAGLKKYIIVNKKPDKAEDLHFDFELQLPLNTKVINRKGLEWDKTSGLEFKDKTLKIGNNDKFSYFKKSLIWDSKDLSIPVDISLFVSDNKLYLRKTIKKEVLEKAVYPLYTDHPTNYTAIAGDGDISQTAVYSDWDTVHDATSGKVADTASTFQVRSYNESSITFFIINRIFVPIDTSGIDDGATITDAKLYLYCTAVTNIDTDGKDYFGVVQTDNADPENLDIQDFNNCGLVDNPTFGSNTIDLDDLTTSDWNFLTLDATGRGWFLAHILF